MNALIDMTGQKFGRLTVMKLVRRYRIFWECLCDCGNSCVVAAHRLSRGITRSCGCLMRESVSRRAVIRNTVHSHNMVGKRTGAHKTWSAMMSRCFCESSADYPMYGGRGITVCDEWKNYVNFYRDMGDRPKDKSIDRINVYGNYEPNNCRWATRSEQQRNRRDNQGKW